MIQWSLTYQGEYKTIQIIENLKTLGFRYATHAGVSLSLDDLSVPPKKRDEVLDAETFVRQSTHGGYRGTRTAIEELQSVIDTWHRTSENVKQHVIDYFEATNILNPVYMMAFSGARGNVSQVRQLVGMRGLMADPKGDILGFPIRSNFREGLTVTEYMISCYGARKGVVDTALRTADAGYLTRRLVDVAQHVVVKQGSCGTRRGITVSSLTSYGKTVLKLHDRLVGRVVAADYTHEGRLIARRNEPISEELADALVEIRKRRNTTAKDSGPPLRVRSPLTCELRSGVCQLCYGWSLAQNSMVTLGEAVGIIAGQSIGEPGTQLTMRTFHTGGVFTGDVDEQFRTPHPGRVTFPTPFPGKLIRDAYGQIAFLVKAAGCMLITDETRNVQTQVKVPLHTALFVREGQYVYANELIGQFNGVGSQQNERVRTKKIVFSEMSGQVILEKTRVSAGRLEEKVISPSKPKKPTPITWSPTPIDDSSFSTTRALGTAWILAGDRLGSTHELLPLYSSSGNLLGPHVPLEQLSIRSMHEGLVCLRPDIEGAGSILSHPMRPFPPGATRRVTPSPRPNRQDPAYARKALYIPLLSGQYQRVHTGGNSTSMRIITTLGDCVAFPKKLFTRRPLNAQESAVKTSVSPSPTSAPTAGTRPFFIYLPDTCKTRIGGSFWRVDTLIDGSRRYGVLPFTTRVWVGVVSRGPWSQRRLSWNPAQRAVSVRPLARTSRRVRFSRWLTTGHALDHSMTLQARPHATRSSIYGLIQSTRPLQLLPSILPPHAQVHRNPYLVRNHLRPEVASYDLHAVVSAFTSLPSLYQFPFSVRSATPVQSRNMRVYPSWLYFPQPGLFDSRAQSQHGAFELATPLQSFVPALVDTRAGSPLTSGRDRTRALLDRVTHNAPRTTFHAASVARVPHLHTIRQVFALRHPELLQFMRTMPTPSFVGQAYHAAHQMHVFTHVLSPWVACVQPSTYTLSAGVTLYRTALFLGWLYQSTRLGIAFTPRAHHQVRALYQVNFASLVAETFVVAHAPISMVSLDRLQTIHRRLSIAQSFEGEQLHDTTWCARPAVWVKQEPTTRDFASLKRPNIRNRVYLPPFRRWLRTSTYALRIKCRITRRDGWAQPEITLTKPACANTFLDRAWSVGVFSSPPKHATLLGAPNTLHFAQEPFLTQSCSVRDAGETFVMDHKDVILLRPPHVVAFSLENIPEMSCVCSVGQMLRFGDELVPGLALPVSGQVLAMTPSQIFIRRGQPILYYKAASLHIADGEWVDSGHPVVTFAYQRLITGDIVQGIPKVEQLFEASRRQDTALNAHRFVATLFKRLSKETPASIATRQTLARVQRQIIDRIQLIYLSQGVTISDKHFEVIVRQMTSHVRILNPARSGLFRNEVVSLTRAEHINLGVVVLGKEKEPRDPLWYFSVLRDLGWDPVQDLGWALSSPYESQWKPRPSRLQAKAEYVPCVLGITAAALSSESFLSSASFQETTRVLSRDAVLVRTDFLGGLKERVILGDLIPAGTGLFETIRYAQTTTSARVT